MTVMRSVVSSRAEKDIALYPSQAVIQVSKQYLQYLQHMSALLNEPRLTVFVGDDFEFLADNTSSYYVITTGSFDSVTPAASHLQKFYLELLRDALTPGPSGHVSTQGEFLWIHLGLIEDLLKTARSLSPIAKYGYTSRRIPQVRSATWSC